MTAKPTRQGQRQDRRRYEPTQPTQPARLDTVPEARDAEGLLIGSLLLDGSMFSDCARIVREQAFTKPYHRAAWRAMARRFAAGEPFDYALVTADMLASGDVTAEEYGRASAYLTGLIIGVPSSLHAPHYAKLVADAAIRRGIIEASTQAAQWAYEPTDDLPGMLAAVSAMFATYDARMAEHEDGSLLSAWGELESGAGLTGWRTGLAEYDDWTGGFRPQEVHCIGGYAGAGKTWLMIRAVNALVDQGARVCVFSLEMARRSILRRLVANRVGRCAYRVGREGATFTADEIEGLRVAREVLLSDRLAVYQRQTSIAAMSAIVRQARPHAVFVDYAQIMDAPERGQSAYEAATANARALQVLAQRSDCTVVFLSQVNEDHQRAHSQTANLGLKDSGAYGAVSDFVLKLRRLPDTPGGIYLWMGKARHGPSEQDGASAEYVMDGATGLMTRAGAAAVKATPAPVATGGNNPW
jgi:replicative DNA helicase